jgi:transposase InsO family protein
VRWARFRFSIVGPLLACPPPPGELGSHLATLASRRWTHPTTGEAMRYGVSTIERWYYAARNETKDPIEALARKVPSHAGKQPSVSPELAAALELQYRQHPSWTYELHRENLLALAKEQPELGRVPSATTVARYMKNRGLVKRKKRKKRDHEEGSTFEPRERRSFEASHVHALWHSDYHVGSRRVIDADGAWHKAHLLTFLDDYSRLVCHAQWYLEESTETFVHGLSQAIQKRGLPRALLTDNGAPMMGAEAQEGLARLSIAHHTTLPYTPEQNGKQESYWGLVEGRLLAMLEGEPELTLTKLNEATQAWVELDYHRKRHSEIETTPLERALGGPNVARLSPPTDVLRRAFRKEEVRTQRRSDGTITIEGVRFEIPERYRVLLRPTVRFARWDLSTADLVDARHGTHLATLLPIDKRANADGRRRVLTNLTGDERRAPPSGIAPRLRQLMAEYAATGLPPAYLPIERAIQNAAENDGIPNSAEDDGIPNHDHPEDDDR